jgi:molybdopterin/thiamine biosynthesis adenylyltransferase
MNTERIASVLDVARMAEASVVVVGCGGSANFVMNLVRCGVRRLKLLDPDTVSDVNMVRQDYLPSQVGQPKVTALSRFLRDINPDLEVESLQADVTTIPEEAWDDLFGRSDLLISTTDSFAAQSMTNRIALKQNVPIIWPGIYAGGKGGEIAFWYRGLPCLRCLVPSRYEAQANADGRSLDPPSDGTTIFDDAYVDAIAGMIAVGLLSRHSFGKYADLVRSLGDRNFLQLKIHPDHRWNGRDIVRERLGIAESNDEFFAFNTVARRDPDRGLPACPDCRRYGQAERPFAVEA